MSWAENDVISVELNQTFLGQNIVNKLFYKIIEIVGEVIIEEILQILAETLIDALISVQSTNLSHMTQTFLDETDGIGIEIISYTPNGTRDTGDNMPSYVAFGMTKGVTTRLTRPGGIRIGGIREEAASGNNIVGGYETLLDAVGAVLEADQVIEDSELAEMTLAPVVVGRNTDGSLDLARVASISHVGSQKITSQVSRRL